MARILLCSDDALDVETLTAQLVAEGHDVLLAREGLEALDIVATASPDLVFLAEHIPVFDAFETCRTLRGNPDVSATLPIILLPGDRPDPRRIESAGFTEVFSPERSGSELHDLLVRRLGPLSNTRPGER